MIKKILFVEPNFPIPSKSKNHKNFLPVGLLKLHDYYKSQGHKTKLVRGNRNRRDIGTRFIPDQIMITSLFTYWSEYFWETVKFYRHNYPDSEIITGGIYVSLMGDDLEFKRRLKKYYAKAHFGLHKSAEKYAINSPLNYSILGNPHPIDYQIIHTSRGCTRSCEFCGTWKIEPDFTTKKTIKNEIQKRKIVFYDNNLLKNEDIEDILRELIELKKQRKILWCESQSGFDGRILLEKPKLAKLLKQAGFKAPRIAWDWGYQEHNKIKKQLDILVNGGFRYDDIFIFMIYNWDIPFEEMEEKRIKCWEWKTQIADCRYRPLDQTYDYYHPKKAQTPLDYHIHENWTDTLVKQFRKNVRRQNICIRQEIKFYSKDFELKKVDKKIFIKTKKMKREEVEKFLNRLKIKYWFPGDITYPNDMNKSFQDKPKTILKEIYS
jgi:hypothetical protein